MKTVVGIATTGTREQYLLRTIESLCDQVDLILIYDNSRYPDKADNGKFYVLDVMNREPCFFLSCDDDLIYPPGYVDFMQAAAKRIGGIVTLHGRRLRGTGMNYYRDHQAYRFTQEVQNDIVIDVAGTGVTGFFTHDFNPIGISSSPDLCMSDLVFSLEAARQGKRIVLLQHAARYVMDQKVPVAKTIHGQFAGNCARQSELADEIYTLKYGNN